MPIPVYPIQAPGPERDANAATLGEGVTVLADAGALPGREPGVVVLDAATVEPEVLLELLSARAQEEGAWRVAILGASAEGELASLSLGPSVPLSEARDFLDDPRAQGTPFLDLSEVLVRMSRARHDLNNLLTAAMAETQLMMMDVEEGTEARESLEIIERQLRRVRDLMASTPRPPAAAS